MFLACQVMFLIAPVVVNIGMFCVSQLLSFGGVLSQDLVCTK